MLAVEETVDHLSIYIDGKLAGLTQPSSQRCIFRVHDQLRSLNQNAYEPAIVAIGPYHRGKPNLREMQNNKFHYLRELLMQRKETTVGRYVTVIRDKLAERAFNCYAERIFLDEDEFVEMMLFDGCFIIELFRKYIYTDLRHEDDPIFGSPQILFTILHDLILVENQLPFFILEELFDMTRVPSDCDIIMMASEFLANITPNRDLEPPKGIAAENIKHLLGLVHDNLCFPVAETRRNYMNFRIDRRDFIKSATELQEFGVQFRRSKERNSQFDIKFINGVLEVSPLFINEDMERLLRNLVAYEHFLPGNQLHYVCDYLVFMDYLINSLEDVQLLRETGIIENYIADDAMVYNMLDKVGKHFLVPTGKFTFAKEFVSLNMHCWRLRNIWMAHLRRNYFKPLRKNYFNNPWAFVSFLAAVALLLLTVAQTVFSALSLNSK